MVFSFCLLTLCQSKRDSRDENPTPLVQNLKNPSEKSHQPHPDWQRLFFHQISVTRVKIGKTKIKFAPLYLDGKCQNLNHQISPKTIFSPGIWVVKFQFQPLYVDGDLDMMMDRNCHQKIDTMTK